MEKKSGWGGGKLAVVRTNWDNGWINGVCVCVCNRERVSQVYFDGDVTLKERS